MDILMHLAEEKIREAMENGVFDSLPGKGQKIIPEDLSMIPEDLRAGYIILKNAGVLPEEMQLKKELVTLQNLIDCCYDEEEKRELKKKINEKILRFNLLMEKRKKQNSPVLKAYLNKIYGRFR
ncbi:DUF1992 domain-containing protein [Carboxydothermus islandicus]|uniref:DUF1992 domain-containing protein n=1 Tax=Carboxydothermus islandicus TaxID=661089 RepID=A0A1L8D007_9THEO|nr:DUF1992 domain-containing protein [Carboxydothermus islandicus]GAV24526.1 DUF1992 domain-containing protein [Carboxydothermus islandicus]